MEAKPTSVSRLSAILPVVLAFYCAQADSAEDNGISISPSCTNFYSGRNHVFTVVDNAEAGRPVRLEWRLEYLKRTAASGEKTMEKDGATFSFKFPELNPGVVADTQLTVSAGDKEVVRNLTFFHPNPFEGMKKTLEKQKISLWSPSGGDTAKKVLERLEVPFTEIANFAEAGDGTVVIHAIDFSAFSGVEKDLTALCERGCRILVINPKKSSFAVPAEAKALCLEGNAKIKNFNKKLDDEFWFEKFPNQNSMTLAQKDGKVVLDVGGGWEGFAYFSAKIAKGELVICTWEIFERADDSPAPVYLLKELMGK